MALVVLSAPVWRSDAGKPPALGSAGQQQAIQVRATSLAVPWKVVELAGGDLLVTERSGTLKRIGSNGASITVPGVYQAGEAGLLGVALHPRFSDNRWLYLYMTEERDGRIANRVDRYRLQQDRLTDRTPIVTDIPGAKFHDGGAVEFGPDGYLYIATGDANEDSSAQDTKTLAGKILRLTDTGTIPVDNPFGTAVYSYGHRNPQGLAWDGQGRLWATEHGPSGLQSGFDELNRIEKGGNYGWPVVKGDETRPGMIKPAAHSGPDVTWAPSGIAYADGHIYFAGLRGRALYKVSVNQDAASVRISEFYKDTYGRLRGVTAGQGQGNLLVTTSNRDGRGEPIAEDDRILNVPLRSLD